MASCNPFSVNFKGSFEDLFKKIKPLIDDYKGSISGDYSNGSFFIPIPVIGTVEGEFSVSGQTCTIHITKKPFTLPCGLIEKFVKKHPLISGKEK